MHVKVGPDGGESRGGSMTSVTMAPRESCAKRARPRRSPTAQGVPYSPEKLANAEKMARA